MAENSKYSNEVEESEFSSQLKTLILLTKRLRFVGTAILMILILILVMLAMYVILHRQLVMENVRNGYSSYYNPFWMVGIYALLFLVVGIIALFYFNQLKNKGNIIYEELTEEIDWSTKRKEFIHRPSIETRIIIKEFLKATDLPFTSGNNGQAFYLVLYIVVSVATIIVIAMQ